MSLTFRRRLLDEALAGAVPFLRGRVLDVGGKKAGKRGDFRPPMDRVASWAYANPDPATEPDFLCGAEAIPADAGSFDTAVMTEVLEYVPDPAAAFREVHRVLVPGGRLILTVPFLCPMHGDWESDRARFTEVRLRELAAAAGFETESLEPMGSLGSVIHDLLHAALGYARADARPARLRRRLLGMAAPLFRALDALSLSQRKYVHTGYFLRLRKPEATGP